MPHTAAELLVVMPVYNEQASVRKVVLEFFQEIENWTERFTFIALDDGSKDDTPRVLERLKNQLGDRFEVIRHPNKGHGQTVMQGYRIAVERQIPYVMQIDSDGQCDPQYFFRFWRLRDKADVIYGVRVRRDDGVKRMLASMVLRLFILAGFHLFCADANVPYRLMRTEKIAPLLDKVPKTFSLANIGIAVLLQKDPTIVTQHIRIRFRERYGGEPSVRLSLFGRKALELYRDIKDMLKNS